ncbi:MAG: response regulator [Gammaproteobacteria bacterium]|nr:response regulator [Gammaproteobacteria bacterium]
MTDNAIPTIVVVDNSPSVKELFERATEKLGIELKIFDSATASGTYLATNKPKLLFLNIKLPGKDGLIFLKELRNLPLHKDTSVVMISSKDYEQDRSVSRQLGAVEFITKPMPIQILTDVVLKYI